MAKLFLHTCCGPCFLGSWDYVSDFEVTNYFYNPNIQPKSEYQKRLENLKKAAIGKSSEIISGRYQINEHKEAICGDTSFPKRCVGCYRLRLEETAIKARELGFELFSTTLLVSPYQQHETLNAIGKELGEKYQLEFYCQDFRPNFRKGQDLAKEREIYQQKYCGCLLSIGNR